MSRSTAREHIFKIVYEIPFQSDDVTLIMDRYIRDFVEEALKEEDFSFIRSETEGILRHLNELDETIGSALQGWKVNRLSKVDLAILRVSAYELCYDADIPVQVSINEAVELAKKYSMEQSPTFVNGILGTIAAKRSKD